MTKWRRFISKAGCKFCTLFQGKEDFTIGFQWNGDFRFSVLTSSYLNSLQTHFVKYRQVNSFFNGHGRHILIVYKAVSTYILWYNCRPGSITYQRSDRPESRQKMGPSLYQNYKRSKQNLCFWFSRVFQCLCVRIALNIHVDPASLNLLNTNASFCWMLPVVIFSLRSPNLLFLCTVSKRLFYITTHLTLL